MCISADMSEVETSSAPKVKLNIVVLKSSMSIYNYNTYNIHIIIETIHISPALLGDKISSSSKVSMMPLSRAIWTVSGVILTVTGLAKVTSWFFAIVISRSPLSILW